MFGVNLSHIVRATRVDHRLHHHHFQLYRSLFYFINGKYLTEFENRSAVTCSNIILNLSHPIRCSSYTIYICLDSFSGLDILRVQMCHGKMDRMGDEHDEEAKNKIKQNKIPILAIMNGLNKSPYCIMHNVYTRLCRQFSKHDIDCVVHWHCHVGKLWMHGEYDKDGSTASTQVI